jgi:hypothetical protein
MALATLTPNQTTSQSHRSLAGRRAKSKSRSRWSEKLAVLAPGLLPTDAEERLRAFWSIFGFRRTGAIVTRVGQGPRAWTAKPGALTINDVARHLLGDAMPRLAPQWVGTRSLGQSRFCCLDVDCDRGNQDATVLSGQRPSRPTFQARMELVFQALRRLGIDPDDPRQVLNLPTPSGGRHLYIFFDRLHFLDQYQELLRSAGLKFAKGQIEFYPSERQGLRLPFGFIPGTRHDPTAWLRFVRDFRLRRIKKFSLTELYDALEGAPRASAEPTAPRPHPLPQRSRVAPPGSPQSSPNTTLRLHDKVENTSCRLVPVRSTQDAERLLAEGITAAGTRTAILKTLAAHFIFVRGLSALQASDKLIGWALDRRHVSHDIHRDLADGTSVVADHIRRMCLWYETHRKPRSESARPILTSPNVFSLEEVKQLHDKLRPLAAETRRALADFLLSFLAFAKQHGERVGSGSAWRAAPAVNAVIRKWPGCHHMHYKAHIELATTLGLFRLHREKWQNPNGPGRARTYELLIAVDHGAASLSYEQAIRLILGPSLDTSGKRVDENVKCIVGSKLVQDHLYGINDEQNCRTTECDSEEGTNTAAVRAARPRRLVAQITPPCPGTPLEPARVRDPTVIAFNQATGVNERAAERDSVP